MIVINTVSNERFSLNGIEYFKNFLSFVYGDNVGIYNAYDKTDQRVSLDLYSNFIVDGIVYESAALLQSALLGVIYTRDTLGAVNTVLKGSVKPTDTPTGTGVAFWVATQAGTYTNFGGVIVSANSFAVISRDSLGAFSISQTALDITSKVNVSDVINNLTSTETTKPLSAAQGKALNEKNIKIEPWTAKLYASGDQVNYLGKDWVSNAATLSTDVPGTSSKWVERLIAYSNYITGETYPNIISDFTAENGATISMTGDNYLKISTAADKMGYAVLNNTAIKNIEFSVTINGYSNPSPNWFGLGTKDGKKIIIGLKTGLEAQKGQIYSTLNGFGIDSSIVKDADRASAYSIVNNDVIYVRIKGEEVFVYKKVGNVLTELSYNNLTGYGITFGFSFVFTQPNVSTQQYIAGAIKTKLIGLDQRVSEIETKPVVVSAIAEQVGYYRKLAATDIENINGSSVISGNNLSISQTSTSLLPTVLFNNNIKSILYTVPSTLPDGSQQSLIIGEGLEGATRVFAYIGFRNNQDGFTIYNLYASSQQAFSLNGDGRMTLPNLQPEIIPVRIATNDVIKISILDDNIIYAEIKKAGTTDFIKWFYFDKRGNWALDTRLGWNIGLRLGICRVYGSNIGVYTAFNNISVSDKLDINGNITAEYRLIREDIKQKMFNKIKPKWLALGDSITDNNDSNGKSYVGFANATLGYDLVNRGYGGWTMLRLWRDKAIGRTTGNPTKPRWDTEVATSDIITIFAGTNDFDTGFAIAPNDATMDTYPDPHPRFGTFDKLHADYKNAHTTLGCLRLIIDYIYTQNSSAKIYIILPAFRLKKNIVGSVLNTWTVNDEGRTIYDYALAIKQVAEEYNLPVVDFIFTAGMNEFNIDSYTYDKLHFSENGGKFFGNILTKALI